MEKTLVQKVAERKKLIKKIVEFVDKIVVERGKLVKREQGSSHTHTIWELDNFSNFYFQGDFCQTMFGGNDMKIWHSDKSFNNFVFHVSWQASLDEAIVEEFVEGDWQKEILVVIRNRSKIIAVIERKNKADEVERQKKQVFLEADKKLKEEASRLRL